MLHTTGLTKRFTEGRLDVTVLQGVDLQVHPGSSKSMLLQFHGDA